MANTGRPRSRPNRLLAALERSDGARLDDRLEPVDLGLGDVLHESWKARRWVYFPAGSIVSLLYETHDGGTCEIALIGNEGVVGASPCMGGEKDPARAIVQSAGPAHRMRVGELRQEFESGGEVQRLLLRYMQALLIQIAQSAVCNRHHSVDQQLCRWLLMCMDRLPSNRLFMTHELIARMLGVRREGVTEAAGKLQRAGAISYQRGHIELLDRAPLEAMSCECYGVVRREFAQLLPWTYSEQQTCEANFPNFTVIGSWHMYCTTRWHPDRSDRSIAGLLMSIPAPALAQTKSTASHPMVARQTSGNHLIDALPRAERAHMLGECQRVDLTPGNVLYEPGRRIRHAWFPLSGFVSLSTQMECRERAEIDLVGDEGMLGAALMLGVAEASQRARGLGAGTALRIGAPALRRELRRGSALRRLLNRYIHVLMRQLMQNATCIASHKIEPRLARLLLMSRDRASYDSLNITQASLAAMLGVRRVGVSGAAGALQRRGLIRYSRGRLSVTDRGGLEHAACDCYRADCASRRRWLG